MAAWARHGARFWGSRRSTPPCLSTAPCTPRRGRRPPRRARARWRGAVARGGAWGGCHASLICRGGVSPLDTSAFVSVLRTWLKAPCAKTFCRVASTRAQADAAAQHTLGMLCVQVGNWFWQQAQTRPAASETGCCSDLDGHCSVGRPLHLWPHIAWWGGAPGAGPGVSMRLSCCTTDDEKSGPLVAKPACRCALGGRRASTTAACCQRSN